MIYKYTELKTDLNRIAYSNTVEEVREFIEDIQNKALEEVKSRGNLIGKVSYSLPRTDKIFIKYLDNLLNFYEYKYKIEKSDDYSRTKDIVTIEWDLNLE